MVEIEKRQGRFINLVRQYLDEEEVKYDPFISYRSRSLEPNAIQIKKDDNIIRLEEIGCELIRGFSQSNNMKSTTDFVNSLTEKNESIIRFVKTKNRNDLEIRTSLVNINRLISPVEGLLTKGLRGELAITINNGLKNTSKFTETFEISCNCDRGLKCEGIKRRSEF